MDSWTEDLLNAILKIKSEKDFFRKIISFAKKIGFEHCAYGIQMPYPICKPAVAIFSDYPKALKERYIAQNYLQIDPTVHHAMKSTSALIWSDSVFKNAPQLWQEMQSFGLEFGWTKSSRAANGAVCLLSLARGNDKLSPAELRSKKDKMNFLTQFAHEGMIQFVAPMLVPESKAALSKREIEVLSWSAEGKTAYEISQILVLSEHTVNFHVQNAVAKLGASNKMQAAVKAAVLGLLA